MEREAGGGLGWGTHVNPWVIHVNVWQKPLQYCKVIPTDKNKWEKNLNKGKKNILSKASREVRLPPIHRVWEMEKFNLSSWLHFKEMAPVPLRKESCSVKLARNFKTFTY